MNQKNKRMTPENFATPDFPLRGSSLETFMGVCGGFTVSRMLYERQEVGAAAHTGTAIGRAIEIHHQKGGSRRAFADILAQVQQESEKGVPGSDDQDTFRLANWTEVAGMLDAYRNDRRNKVKVIESSLEESVTLTLPAHPIDPTGKPVYLTGHMDQVRYDLTTGNYQVWDVKSGKAPGLEMSDKYKWQVSCYVLGYRAKYPDRKVVAGGIINVRDYLKARTISNPNYDPNAPSRNPASIKRVANPDPNGRTKTIPNPNYDPNAPTRNPASAKTIKVENPGENARVFYPIPVAQCDYDRLMHEVALRVALVRLGHTPLNPSGFWCGLCPLEAFGKCQKKLAKGSYV